MDVKQSLSSLLTGWQSNVNGKQVDGGLMCAMRTAVYGCKLHPCLLLQLGILLHLLYVFEVVDLVLMLELHVIDNSLQDLN